VINLARTDRSVLGRWWWTVDRWTLLALLVLMAFGAVLTLAATPAVAERIGLDTFYLARRQLGLLPLAAATVIAVSLLTPRSARRVAAAGFVVSFALLLATVISGSAIKGAARWVDLAGFSLQPSELVKPCFAVVIAWMLAAARTEQGLPGVRIAVALWLAVIGVLLLQPDVGQAFVVTAVWGIQVFLAGLPLPLVGIFACLTAAVLIGFSFAMPHATARIQSFLDPEAGDRYQVDRAIEAFIDGGLFGRGPGEGRVKEVLPDAHSDFIFAVAGEELGLVACLIIVTLFAFVVLRGFALLQRETDLFVLLAAAGLLAQFGLQALINMASTLHLMPTKGMTLPFISYGGSSLLALAFAMGLLLAFTRRRVGRGELS
jgi:cell division protein FtsW